MAASDQTTCGEWMPRARDYCGRRPGHLGDCRTAAALEDTRQRLTARRRGTIRSTPEDRARWRHTHKLKRYGLTQVTFDQLLAGQGYACAMCREPFADGQAIHIDHDHNLGCHPQEKRACDRCRRGLLCLRCNTGLGYIEGMSVMARAYLDAQKPRRVRDSGASVLRSAG